MKRRKAHCVAQLQSRTILTFTTVTNLDAHSCRANLKPANKAALLRSLSTAGFQASDGPLVWFALIQIDTVKQLLRR
jgi:hypothetical protein